MNPHQGLRNGVVLLTLLASLALAAGCGGGGGSGGRGDGPRVVPGPPLTGVQPSVLYTKAILEFIVFGVDVGDAGDPVTIRFTASSGTPFSGGTSTTADVEGRVASSTEIAGRMPADVETEQVVCDVTCIWPDGRATTLGNSTLFRVHRRVVAPIPATGASCGHAIAVTTQVPVRPTSTRGSVLRGAARRN